VRTHSLIQLILLSFSICIFSNHSFAVPGKDEVDIESVKAPPRDVKDILLVLSQARPDKTLIDKATKVLALPVPSTNDAETLNHYYYRRAKAEEVLENSKGALEAIKKAVLEYPSPQVDLRIDELFQYSQIEGVQGSALAAKKILEEGKPIIPQSLRGWTLTFDRSILSYCLVLGDFDCAKSSLSTLEADYNALISVAKNPNFLYRMGWEINLEQGRERYFLAEGKFIEAERSI